MWFCSRQNKFSHAPPRFLDLRRELTESTAALINVSPLENQTSRGLTFLQHDGTSREKTHISSQEMMAGVFVKFCFVVEGLLCYLMLTSTVSMVSQRVLEEKLLSVDHLWGHWCRVFHVCFGTNIRATCEDESDSVQHGRRVGFLLLLWIYFIFTEHWCFSLICWVRSGFRDPVCPWWSSFPWSCDRNFLPPSVPG